MSSTQALNLSPAERQSFAHLFAMADPANSGMVTGDAAVKFFEGFQLPTLTLGQIWSIADSGNNGFLTPNSFSVALRLIARAQRGESVNEQAVQQPGAPPLYSGAGLTADRAPAITSEDKARFTRIFTMVGPTNGVLSSEQAKDVFMKSKLPIAKLGEIWNLADTKQRGALDLTDFIIGMHYIQGTMNGTIPTLPSVLPPGLYEEARESAPAPSASAAPAAAPYSTPMQPQRTGTDPYGGVAAATPGTPSVMSPMTTGLGSMPSAAPPRSAPAVAPPAPSGDWLISSADKSRYDGFFDSLDDQRAGYVDGGVVVPFFLQSGLDEGTLAHVWDLADITQDGTLSRDEFAVAMHLINERMTGKALPEQLPAALLPPSMRTQTLPPAGTTKQTETQRELFSLLDTDVPPTMSASEKTTAFGAPVAPSMMPMQPEPTSVPPAANASVPAEAPAEPQNRSEPADPFQAFDDDFDAPVPVAVADPKRDEALATLTSTNKGIDEMKERQATATRTLGEQQTTLAELEAQLARAKSEHAEQETAVAAVEQKVQAQESEIDTLRQSVIREESEVSALKTQRAELEQKLLQDRDVAFELKRELSQLQVETEKMRSDYARLGEEARAQQESITAMRSQLSSAKEEQAALQPTTMAAANHFNPFSVMTGGAEDTQDRAAFDSQYGFDDVFTAAGTGGVAAAGGAAAGGAAAYEADADADEREEPEEADAVPYGQTAPVYGGVETLGQENAAISVPGDFPGEANEDVSQTMEREMEGQALTRDLSGKLLQAVDEPSAAPPVPAAAQPPPSVTNEPVSSSTASMVAIPPSSDPVTPATQSAQVDDFDKAFSRMGLAHVVHTSTPRTTAQEKLDANPLDQNFGSVPESEAPVSSATGAAKPVLVDVAPTTQGTPALPSYLQSTATRAPPAVPSPTSPPAVPVPVRASAPTSTPGLGSASGISTPASAAPVSLPAQAPSVPVSMPIRAPAQAPARDGFDDQFEPRSGAPGSTGAGGTERAPTPPLPGDIGPVRQLCQMGFSRSAVVRALERSNYRTERALERLLSAAK